MKIDFREFGEEEVHSVEWKVCLTEETIKTMVTKARSRTMADSIISMVSQSL